MNEQAKKSKDKFEWNIDAIKHVEDKKVLVKTILGKLNLNPVWIDGKIRIKSYYYDPGKLKRAEFRVKAGKGYSSSKLYAIHNLKAVKEVMIWNENEELLEFVVHFREGAC